MTNLIFLLISNFLVTYTRLKVIIYYKLYFDPMIVTYFFSQVHVKGREVVLQANPFMAAFENSFVEGSPKTSMLCVKLMTRFLQLRE